MEWHQFHTGIVAWGPLYTAFHCTFCFLFLFGCRIWKNFSFYYVLLLHISQEVSARLQRQIALLASIKWRTEKVICVQPSFPGAMALHVNCEEDCFTGWVVITETAVKSTRRGRISLTVSPYTYIWAACLSHKWYGWVKSEKGYTPRTREASLSLSTGSEEETGPMCFPEIPLPRNLEAMPTNYMSSCPLSLTLLGLPMPETGKVLTFPLTSRNPLITCRVFLQTREAVCSGGNAESHFTCWEGAGWEVKRLWILEHSKIKYSGKTNQDYLMLITLR